MKVPGQDCGRVEEQQVCQYGRSEVRASLVTRWKNKHRVYSQTNQCLHLSSATGCVIFASRECFELQFSHLQNGNTMLLSGTNEKVQQAWHRNGRCSPVLSCLCGCSHRQPPFCHLQRWVAPQEAGAHRLHCLMTPSNHHAPGTHRASHLPPRFLPTVHSESWGPGGACSKIVPLAAKQRTP